MVRRVLLLALVAVLAALPASAGVAGFALTFEEGLLFPPLNTPVAPGVPAFNAAVGHTDIFSTGNVQITDRDPVNGVPPCDPTTTKALILDSSSLVAEVHLRFPGPAAGNVIVLDKMELGAERTDVRGLRAGVFSGRTRVPEINFEFGEDGYVYVRGQRVPTATGELRYENLWANDCAAGIDNHITLQMWHNMLGGNLMVDVSTHGLSPQTYRLGPFPTDPAVTREGIGGMYLYAPPLGGRYYVDGMVCVANAPIVTPSGSDRSGANRRR